MAIGVLFAWVAGLMWGLAFVGPLLLPDYPAALLVAGRYLAFGLVALPLAWWDRAGLRALSRADWQEALKLSAVGNLLYYLLLASAIQRAGGPVPTMVIGTLPVVIALSANVLHRQRDGLLPWHRLLPCLVLILAGIACVNHVEMRALARQPQADLARYASGVALAVAAVVCWTWYPLRNAQWLRQHPDRSPRAWATAQGLVTLPMALLGYAVFWAWNATASHPTPMPQGPRPLAFAGLMLAMGLLTSWLATHCWNEASQRLPTALAGQLIVFETLAALLYAYLLRGEAPQWLTLAGVLLLVGGVLLALRIRPRSVAISTDSGSL